MHKNQYRFDIVFVSILILLQVIFTYFFPIQFNETVRDVTVSQNLVLLTFTRSSGETFIYIPMALMIFSLALIYLIIFKREKQTLIYGFGLVLVVKAHFVIGVFNLVGKELNQLTTANFISLKVIGDYEVYAQDLSFYILLILAAIKIALAVYEIITNHHPTTIKNEPTL